MIRAPGWLSGGAYDSRSQGCEFKPYAGNLKINSLKKIKNNNGHINFAIQSILKFTVENNIY